MKLKELISDITIIRMEGNADIEITDITTDSRTVKQGDLFIAVRGTQTDSHIYINDVVQKGAHAIICEQIPEVRQEDVTYIMVENSGADVGRVATAFYGQPSKRLKLVGVTGTNGKTTIATLLYKLFKRLGYHCGLCSTVCNYIDDEEIPATQTTPDPITLNRLLGEMADRGCQYAFMEVSSHSVHQQRISGLRFAGAIFTNLTRDHLDYHKTFENYRDAKKAFFDGLDAEAFALVNADDRNGMFMVQNCKAHVKTYSRTKMADFHARILEMDFHGMFLHINGTDVHIPLVGSFNVSNALAIYGAAVLLGEDVQDILTGMSVLQPVPGRFETLPSPKGYIAIVDYAHTPDALINVLSTIHSVLGDKGRIITVCGCGGNRDKGKRPQMAHEAVINSNQVILTSDNPRNERPEDIIQDMLTGITLEEEGKVLSITDRQQAIKTACTMAQKGDVVLIAGKGHETYQEIQGVKYHFDDKEVLVRLFRQEEEVLSR